MFAIHMCEKICFYPEILVRHYVLCVCTCTNQLVLSTEVTRLNFLNSIVMGQIHQCGFQSHVAIDRYCIFLEINTFELNWVELIHVIYAYTGYIYLPYNAYAMSIAFWIIQNVCLRCMLALYQMHRTENCNLWLLMPYWMIKTNNSFKSLYIWS